MKVVGELRKQVNFVLGSGARVAFFFWQTYKIVYRPRQLAREQKALRYTFFSLRVVPVVAYLFVCIS